MEIIKAHGKVNLGLWVIGKRPDSYHEIYTLFHTVDLHDRIFIKKAPLLSVKSSSPFVPEGEENIVFQAVKKFEEMTGIPQNYEIFIEKNIPVGAGLGGGSSDAAAVLLKLNEMNEYPLTEEELFEIAKELGADVPFFLKGGFAVGEGIGEKLTFLEKKIDQEIFIIYPNVEVSTERVYSALTEKFLTKKEEIPIIDILLSEYDEEDISSNIENKLGEVAKELYPELQEVINTLEYLGYEPHITGSGSAIFAFGKPDEKVENVCKAKNWKLFTTKLI